MPCHGQAGAAGQQGQPPQAMGHGAVGMSPPSHGIQGSRVIPPELWDTGQQGHPQRAIGHWAAGKSPPSHGTWAAGTYPLSHGTLGSRNVPTKTWDVGQQGHPLGSRDVHLNPWDVGQWEHPQVTACGTAGMSSLIRGTWGSRHVPTESWDVGHWGCPPELWGSGMIPFTPGLCMEVNGAQHPPCHPGLSLQDPEPSPRNGPTGFPVAG